MRRRQVIAGVAALVVVPRQSAAQRAAAKIPRVGVLTPADSADTAIFDAFRAGLRDLGYVEGHNLILEFRLAHGDAAVLPKLAADLASVPVDVILPDGEAVRVAMAATKQIPIVMAGGPGGDPVALGIAASLARPGGNVTGRYPMQAALSAKRLEILQLAFPQISTVAVLLRPSNSTADDLSEKSSAPGSRSR